MKSEEMNFKITTLQYGQERPYADFVYDYEIESGLDEGTVEIFATKVLKPCELKYSPEKIEESYFNTTYTFGKVGSNTYRYTVREPSFD